MRDAVEALTPDQDGQFAKALEQALSSGADAGSAVAAARTLRATSEAQSKSVVVKQTDGARMLGALASGKT